MITSLIFQEENDAPFFTKVDISHDNEIDLAILIDQIADVDNEIDIHFI